MHYYYLYTRQGQEVSLFVYISINININGTHCHRARRSVTSRSPPLPVGAPPHAGAPRKVCRGWKKPSPARSRPPSPSRRGEGRPTPNWRRFSPFSAQCAWSAGGRRSADGRRKRAQGRALTGATTVSAVKVDANIDKKRDMGEGQRIGDLIDRKREVRNRCTITINTREKGR